MGLTINCPESKQAASSETNFGEKLTQKSLAPTAAIFLKVMIYRLLKKKKKKGRNSLSPIYLGVCTTYFRDEYFTQKTNTEA